MANPKVKIIASNHDRWYDGLIGEELDVVKNVLKELKFMDDKPRYWVKGSSMPEHLKDRKCIASESEAFGKSYPIFFWHCITIEEPVEPFWHNFKVGTTIDPNKMIYGTYIPLRGPMGTFACTQHKDFKDWEDNILEVANWYIDINNKRNETWAKENPMGFDGHTPQTEIEVIPHMESLGDLVGLGKTGMLGSDTAWFHRYPETEV